MSTESCNIDITPVVNLWKLAYPLKVGGAAVIIGELLSAHAAWWGLQAGISQGFLPPLPNITTSGLAQWFLSIAGFACKFSNEERDYFDGRMIHNWGGNTSASPATASLTE